MVKRFYWSDDISEEMFNTFLQFQNEIPEDSRFEVWLDCDGGECSVAEMLNLLFESYGEDKFQLVGCGRLCSAALDLFTMTKCQKYLVPGTIGMAHTISRKVYVDGKGNMKMKFSEEKIIHNKYPLVDAFEYKLNQVMDKTSVEQYFNNEDVWLNTEDIEKFLT